MFHTLAGLIGSGRSSCKTQGTLNVCSCRLTGSKSTPVRFCCRTTSVRLEADTTSEGLSVQFWLSSIVSPLPLSHCALCACMRALRAQSHAHRSHTTARIVHAGVSHGTCLFSKAQQRMALEFGKKPATPKLSYCADSSAHLQ